VAMDRAKYPTARGGDCAARQVVGITAHVENPKVITAATETPRGELPHAVGGSLSRQ
jgi:hypothetical protein